MHGLIFETSVWLLAESTRLLPIVPTQLHKYTHRSWVYPSIAAWLVFTCYMGSVQLTTPRSAAIQMPTWHSRVTAPQNMASSSSLRQVLRNQSPWRPGCFNILHSYFHYASAKITHWTSHSVLHVIRNANQWAYFPVMRHHLYSHSGGTFH